MEYNLDIIILVSVLIGSIIAFFKEWLPLEVTALSATGILLMTDVITVEEMLSGFSNKAVIIIGAIFIISKSLVKTGFLEVIADKLYNKAGDNKWIIISIFLITTSIISGAGGGGGGGGGGGFSCSVIGISSSSSSSTLRAS